MGSMLELLLKFESYKVFVRQATNCWLTVLVADSVNFPALRCHQRCAQAGGGSHGTNPLQRQRRSQQRLPLRRSPPPRP